MKLWIVVTTREDFLEDCTKFSVYGTNKQYLQNFSNMNVDDKLLIQLRASSPNRSYAYQGPYIITDKPPAWAAVDHKKCPWFEIKTGSGPRWLKRFPWCVFLAPAPEYIDSIRILEREKDPNAGMIEDERAQKVIDDLIQPEFLPKDTKNAYRTNRGVWVRSRAEYMIDNWFAEQGIVTYYEKSLPLSGRLFFPDWYIPKLQLYVEYLGLLGNKDYNLRWEVKKSIYEKNKLNFITLVDSDLENLGISIPSKIPQIKGMID